LPAQLHALRGLASLKIRVQPFIERCLYKFYKKVPWICILKINNKISKEDVMKTFRSLLGRRQFLIATGLASTSALAAKKFGGIIAPVFQKDVAGASERPGIVQVGGASNRYSHLLSPLKIGNVILKNRMLSTKALPHFLQGPEIFPADTTISHHANVAKNGAAVVTVQFSSFTRKFDLDDAGVLNYVAQVADAIHFYGSKANVALTQSGEPEGYNISDVPPPDPSVPVVPEMYRLTGAAKEIPVEMIQKMIEDFVNKAKLYQTLGFDMVNLYMSYRSSILANSLSPAMNKRKDKYGGSLENRARLSIELCQAIKKACGENFLIEAQVSGEEEPGGYTLEDLVEYAKLWEGSIDILQLRGTDGISAHPTGYNAEKGNPVTLRYSEAIKKSGAKIITAPTGGFQDLDLNEEYIASGKADMIAMARAFICDPEYGKKAYEGRGEDVIPCMLCNKCHREAWTSHVQTCSANPTFGIAHRIDRMIEAPVVSKKVAVIGGGPAGMRAALVAAERGHKVTLYEKNDFLGGQLRHADFASFQWPFKEYKDYLIRQMDKTGVDVHLNTKATPEMIKARAYDVILVAVGAEPVISDIPGADGSNVRAPIYVFGNEKALGKNVAVIGGDLIGTQTGMYLAENGHKVVLLTSEKKVAFDAPPVHFLGTVEMACEKLDNFSYLPEVTATGISSGHVTYVDANGNEKSIQADNVVVSAGRKPRQDEAMKFYGSAGRFFVIGDCNDVGFVRACTRTAFEAASQI